MTVHARRIASIPRRTATETWHAVCELIAAPGSAARQELDGITGIASALITEEYSADAPIIISGTGPQIRLYTLHGAAALESDPLDDAPLNQDRTLGEWNLSLPCGEDDLDEALMAIRKAPHVHARSLLDEASASMRSTVEPSGRHPIIDLAALEQS